MRRDADRLHDILDALESVARMIDGKVLEDFLANDTLCYAVAQRLTVVGEAAARISKEIQDRHPEVPWSRIVSFRNVLVHDYFGIHWPLVWITATEHAPVLKSQILAVVQMEFPGL